MTPEQWSMYGGCPTCDVGPAIPCRSRPRPLGDVLLAPHPARPLQQTAESIARLLDDLVAVSVREGVVVGPGDTLIVRVDEPQNLFPDQVDRFHGELEQIRAHIDARLPRGARTVIVACAGQLGVIRGTKAAEEPARGPAAGEYAAAELAGVRVLGAAAPGPPGGAAAGPAADETPDGAPGGERRD